MTVRKRLQDTGIFRWVEWSVSGADLLAPPGSEAHELISRAGRGPDLEEELRNMLANACHVLHRFGCLPERVLPSLGGRAGGVGRILGLLFPPRLTAEEIDARLAAGLPVSVGFPDVALPEPGDPRLARPKGKDAEANLAMLRGARDLIAAVANLWDQVTLPDTVNLSREGLVLLGLGLGWDHCKLFVQATDGERRARVTRFTEDIQTLPPEARAREAFGRGMRQKHADKARVHEAWFKRACELREAGAGPGWAALARLVSAEWAALWGGTKGCRPETVRKALREWARKLGR